MDSDNKPTKISDLLFTAAKKWPEQPAISFRGALKTGWKRKTVVTLLQQFYSELALNLVTESHFLD